jgi:hypothetical protein
MTDPDTDEPTAADRARLHRLEALLRSQGYVPSGKQIGTGLRKCRASPASREKPRPLSDEMIKAVKPYDAGQN